MEIPSKDLEDKLDINNSRAASLILDATPNSETSEVSPVIKNNEMAIDNNRRGNFCFHLSLLLKKNYLHFKRKLPISIFILLSPLFFSLILQFTQILADNYVSVSILHPKIINPPKISKCIGINCHTIGFGIIGDLPEYSPEYDWIYSTMKYVAQDNNMIYGKDIRLLTIGNSTTFFQYLLGHQNITSIAVLFCTTYWTIGTTKIPCKFTENKDKFLFYSIAINSTNEPDNMFTTPIVPGVTDPNLFKLKISLDNGIIKYLAQSKGMDLPQIQITTSNYPAPPNRFGNGVSLVSQGGGFYFYFPPMILFMILLVDMVTEKEKKLRLGLSIMGLKSNSFWVSWTITSAIFLVTISLVQILSGLALGWDFFTNCPFLVNFLIYFIFGFSMVSVAFLLNTLLETQRLAYSISFAFMLGGLVLQIMLSNPIIMFIVFFPANPSVTILIFRYIFYLYPPFNFAKLFCSVSNIASDHYDAEGFKWEKGRPLTWKDMVVSSQGIYSFGYEYDCPSPLLSFIILIITSTIYILLAIYFDQVVSGNRGTTKELLFFLPRRKGQKEESKEIDSNDGIFKDSSHLHSFQDTVLEEKYNLQKNEAEGINQEIRILNISKTFRRGLCSSSNNDVNALRNIYLHLKVSEIFCVLGQNGAGKSTLISLISGIYSPTEGTIKVGEYNIIENLGNIQQMIGLVPQFDILWDNLTAGEHLEMIAKLKGIPDYQINTRIKESLKEVLLQNEINNLVRNFSGGMKRRLSVAISMIGNPKIILLDEPTTGMDPISRKEIWQLIKKMKRNHYILMTTHGMEEADILSDRICILSEGVIQCIGTPLFLKNKFGGGYTLSLNCSLNGTSRAKELVILLFPSMKLVDENQGILLYSFPKKDFNFVASLYSYIASEEIKVEDVKLSQEQLSYIKELKSISKDFGISHPTLERVLFNLSKKETK